MSALQIPHRIACATRLDAPSLLRSQLCQRLRVPSGTVKALQLRRRPTPFQHYSTERQSEKSSTSKPSAKRAREQPELPKANFREIFQGASPLVKGVVYTMIAVMATAETYTYGLWIWHKFYPSPAADEGVVLDHNIARDEND